MAATLADSLAPLLPDVPTALVPAELHPHLRDLAGRLAPVHRCGFEVRLGPSSEVDLQQGVVAGDGEPRKLRAHLSRSPANGHAAGRLDDFLADWEDPSSPLHREIEDLWLEFDRPPAASLSVFMGFPRTPGRAAGRLALARRALDLLAGRAARSRSAGVLERCFDACADGSYVGHIGLMLGRPAPFLRVNVRSLEADSLREYLRQVGWPGAVDEPVQLVRRLRPRVDGLAVCLDVGQRVHGRLGFECHLDRQPQTEPRWASFLDELVASRWCTREKRDALLAWPRLIRPGDATDAWPPDLVRDSLRRPADHFTSFERRLSHVKVVYEAGHRTEAKGYFGFLHTWLRPGLDRDDPGRAGGAHRRRSKGLADAVATATKFLLASRTRAGWWRDFSGTVGATEEWSETAGWSDEWVTAFVGTALAGTSEGHAHEACRRAWTLLAARRVPVAGWGYNRMSPVDADSTAWGLRLAAAAGAAGSSPAREARLALERHGLPDGGVATYRHVERPRPRAARLTPPDGSYDGWCRTSHACVTAAAALSLRSRSLREFLRGAQRGDGSWAAYWWEDDEYATALAAEALAATGRRDDRPRVEAAVRWALGRIGRDGAVVGRPFATAWCVRILYLAGDAPAVREQRGRAVAWLIDRQEPDGGWPASARLLAPRPDVTDRAASDVPPATSLDEARTFTTATALSALTGSVA